MDGIRVVDYFYVTVPNKPGEGARLLWTLQSAGVNLLAFSAFPVGRQSQADFVPEDAAAFKRVAKKAKWKMKGPKKGFLVEGEDRPGAVADLVSALAGAKINITAMDAVSVHHRYGAIFWVAPKDLKKASKVVAAMNNATNAMAAALAAFGP